MSVDYNCCEFCQESLYEETCYNRIIDNYDVCVCDYCVEESIENGSLIEINEESAGYEMLSPQEKRNVYLYNNIYRRTNKGKMNRVKEIEAEIEVLLNEKAELLSK